MGTDDFNTGSTPAMDQHPIRGAVKIWFRSQVTDASENSVLMALGIFSFFLARLYWTFPRIGHRHHLLFSGFLVTFQILTSGDRLFLIHSTRPTKQQSTNYSINSLAIQLFLQGTCTIMYTLIIVRGRLHQKRPIKPVNNTTLRTTLIAHNLQVVTCVQSHKPAILTICKTSKLCAWVTRDSASFIASVVSDFQKTRPLCFRFPSIKIYFGLSLLRTCFALSPFLARS